MAGTRAVRRGSLGFASTVASDAGAAARELGRALAGAGFSPGELVKLNVYYPEGSGEQDVLDALGAVLPSPDVAIGALPLPGLLPLEPRVRMLSRPPLREPRRVAPRSTTRSRICTASRLTAGIVNGGIRPVRQHLRRVGRLGNGGVAA
jgi:hypothetical protein